MSTTEVDEIMKNNSHFNAKRKEIAKDKKDNKNKANILVALSKLSSEAEENFKRFTDLECTDKNKESRLKIELKLILADFAESLYENEKYEECIVVDRKILKLDEDHHQSYARLFEAYCKIGQNDNGVIYGHMLKLKFAKTKLLEKYYSELIPRIDAETKIVTENLKNDSMFKHMKLTKMSYVKFILFIFSVIFLLHGYFTRKK